MNVIVVKSEELNDSELVQPLEKPAWWNEHEYGLWTLLQEPILKKSHWGLISLTIHEFFALTENPIPMNTKGSCDCSLMVSHVAFLTDL